jgi:hypothetical protein
VGVAIGECWYQNATQTVFNSLDCVEISANFSDQTVDEKHIYQRFFSRRRPGSDISNQELRHDSELFWE